MAAAEPQSFTVVEVGVARTPLKERREAPQQPGPQGFSHESKNAGGVEGEIVIHPPYRACLDDLAGFDRVWLIFIFDRNQGWKPKVKPPRSDVKRGLFATRGPHRPSPLGLTCARLLDVGKDRIKVGEIDLLDGTPVVDVKPYLHYADAFPDASAGWVDTLVDAGES